MFKSATFKLTMWYLAIVMVISLGFSFAIYHFGTNEVSFGLQHQSQRIFDRYPVFDQDPFLQPRHDDLNQAAHHLILRLVYFNLLVLVAAGLASYFLARRTLQPIEVAHSRQKRFTADVSHELRTPLTSLKMTSEIALMDTQAAKPDLRAALESNLEDANKMDVLINNLLRLTRLDDTEAQSIQEHVAMQTILTAATTQTAVAAQAKAIQIDAKPASFSLVADQDALVQLVVILLDNAIKYSSPKSKVTVSAQRENNTVRLLVKDAGKGIDPQDLPHVFDRFYRADAARSQSEIAGYGLGLSIAKLIAERHHGEITLTSQPGKGTTVTVLLPQTKQVDVVGESQQQRRNNSEQ